MSLSLSLSEAAREIGWTYHWARLQVAAGNLRAVKIDGAWVVDPKSVAKCKAEKLERATARKERDDEVISI